MKKEQFWRIINEVNEEVGTGDQKTILNKCSEKLSKLPAEEIAAWKNIQTQYVDLADRYDLQQACAKNHIYLSDDSFYYFRVWLLSKGEETFKAVLRDPGMLSRFVEDPNEARFESFSYVSHDVYLKKAYTEEHGEEGLKKLEEEWRAKNPDEKEFDPYWLLYNMYDIYDACKAHPLSEAEKEELRKDVFPPAEKEIEVVWKKDKTGTSEVERVILEKLPQDTEYRRIVIELDSGYEWGSGMLPGARERFHREMSTLFTEAGWEYVAPAFDNASPSYRKGKSLLYCHPMEISGPCEKSLMQEVASLLQKAAYCTVQSYQDIGRVYDISEGAYEKVLNTMLPEIEKELLEEFGKQNGVSDSDRCNAIMERYRIMTLEQNTNALMSTHPYWKCVEGALKDLIRQEKIIKRPDVATFSTQQYMIAPGERPGLDARIKDAAERTPEKEQAGGKEGYERDL